MRCVICNKKLSAGWYIPYYKIHDNCLRMLAATYIPLWQFKMDRDSMKRVVNR